MKLAGWQAIEPSADCDIPWNPDAIRIRGSGTLALDVWTPNGREALTLPVTDGDVLPIKVWDGTFRDGPGHYLMAVRPESTVEVDGRVDVCSACGPRDGAFAAEGVPVMCSRCAEAN